MGLSIMENSILNTIKKLLGLTDTYVAFDQDIIIHINTVFSSLHQMGIGPSDGFTIDGTTPKWQDYFVTVYPDGEDETTFTLDEPKFQQQIVSYIYAKVRLLFDPPANSNLLQALEKNAQELEYRLYTEKGGY